MKTFRTSSTHNYQHVSCFEKALDFSQTVPDQTLSLAEILRDYVVPEIRPFTMPVYETDLIPDLRKLDYVEISDMADRLDAAEIDLKKRFDEHRVKVNEAKSAARVKSKKKLLEDLQNELKAVPLQNEK